MKEVELVDDLCLERLFNAAESLLWCSVLSNGIESAFLLLIPLDERDFPTPEHDYFNFTHDAITTLGYRML